MRQVLHAGLPEFRSMPKILRPLRFSSSIGLTIFLLVMSKRPRIEEYQEPADGAPLGNGAVVWEQGYCLSRRPDYKILDGRIITYIGGTPFEALVTNWATNAWRRVA
jgi:hypothetical protein